jgi:quercetin dioxygenase-like cupin family protein
VYDIGRAEARILVGAEQSDGAWWLGNFRNYPGRLTSLHVHHSADEQFYALEGVVSVWVDGKWHDLPPGALVPCSPAKNSRMVAACVSRMHSITNLPV